MVIQEEMQAQDFAVGILSVFIFSILFLSFFFKSFFLELGFGLGLGFKG